MNSKNHLNQHYRIKFIILLFTSIIISCDNTSKSRTQDIHEATETTILQVDSLKPETDTIDLSSKEESEAAVSLTNKITIGTWIDESGSTYELYKIDNAYYLDNHYYDGSFGTDHLKPIKRYGKRGYVIIDDEREFYLIKNDKLYVYDMFGDIGLIFRPI